MAIKERNEFSEELRALALRFFSFDEEYRSERTEKYMEWSMLLKLQMEHLEEMLNVMQTCDGFHRVKPPELPSSTGYDSVAIHVRKSLNGYSSETLFASLKNQALREAPWESKYGGLPNAEAAAWLAYFTDWDPNKKREYNRTGDHIPNENWHEYYREHFGSNVDEKPKPKRRARKKKKT